MSPHFDKDFVDDAATPPTTSSVKQTFPHMRADAAALPSSLDPFTITTSNGFLPFKAPLISLPPAFDALTKLLEDMPVVRADGTPGLLATYDLGPLIDGGKVLPDLLAEVDGLVTGDGSPDMFAITAAFRDYAFLASAYLLEPCWERWCQGHRDGYGVGRAVLPKEIAGPLVKTGDILDIPPFMSYAAAYALFNYSFKDPNIGTDTYENMRLIRAFEKGLDPVSSEAGFVLTHIDMVKHTPTLVQGATDLLDTVAMNGGKTATTEAFGHLLSAMKVIEASMERMWAQSKPADYISFRTFIFGLKDDKLFPQGVTYEGQDDKAFYRGESGANDSIIPLLDSLLEIPMPKNALTDHLVSFRSYRPRPHREFLAYVRSRASEIGVKDYCCSDVDTAVLYLRLLDHVRSFRWRHWLFAREYIIRRSSHPTATGGSPIVTWLPNQLFAVMDLMCSVWDDVGEDQRVGLDSKVREMMSDVEDQREKLAKEVTKWCSERGVPEGR
ncbi:hypothetical protein MBLNU230_g5976t1 [Neophaeotheca triangularis]